MPKKIFDIIPPHLIEKKIDKIKKMMSCEKSRKRQKKSRERKSPLFVILSVSLAVALIIFGTYLYFKLARVEILIWPITEEISFEETIIADTSIIEIDQDAKKIPAQLIQEEKELWQEFPATGASSKEGLASGTIRVYNKYSPTTPITLKTGTHFLSDSGKYFKSLAKINIPAAKTQGGKLISGYVDVKVVAIESGESYNIGASNFSVPKLAGTPYYYTIYAESTEKMTGGFESSIKVVTTDDIDSAKEELSKKLLNELKVSVEEQISSANLVLFEDALIEDIIETSSSVKAGDEINVFNYKVKAQVQALVFKTSDLEGFAKEYIIEENPGMVWVDNSLIFENTPMTIDLNAGKLTFNLKNSAKIYLQINNDNLKPSLRQKTSSQISEIVYDAYSQEVSKLKVNFWPFWVKKAPKDEGKIGIKLNFE